MKTGKRKKRLLIAAGIFILSIIGVRIAVPFILVKVVNKQLSIIDDYDQVHLIQRPFVPFLYVHQGAVGGDGGG